MDLLAKVAAEQAGKKRTYPVGADIPQWETQTGHDKSRFSPEEYGDYLATSNEIYSAATLRARLMSSLTLKLYNEDGPEKREINRGPAYDALRHVNPFWTRRRLARMDELSMCVWGETAWALEPGPQGPKNIWWIKPSRLKPVPHETDYLGGYIYESATGQRVGFKPDEIVWFRYPNPIDEWSALSPLAAARLAADTASSMMKANNNLFSQGLMMGGLIVPDTDKVTFSEEQARELEQLIDKRYRGVDKAHKWSVLRYEAQFRQLGITPKDAMFADGLNLTLRQVANAYGLPVTLLNDLQNATLSNAREHERLAWSHALVPDSQDRAEEIVEQFLPRFKGSRPQHAEFDYMQVPALQEAASESWLRERQAIEVGALTINEWRKSKGMAPVPWGDVYWAPVNKSSVDDADSHPEGDTGDTVPGEVVSVADERQAVLAPQTARMWARLLDQDLWSTNMEMVR